MNIYLPNRLIFLGCCMVQDINTSIGEFDVSVDDYLFLKEFVTIRYGIHPATIDRWKKIREIKACFEKEISCSIYTLLPGVMENSCT